MDLEYTEAPSVVVKGVGNGAGGCEIQTFIEIDTPAVRMGVAVDAGEVTNSTTPTHFAFDYPVIYRMILNMHWW